VHMHAPCLAPPVPPACRDGEAVCRHRWVQQSAAAHARAARGQRLAREVITGLQQPACPGRVPGFYAQRLRSDFHDIDAYVDSSADAASLAQNVGFAALRYRVNRLIATAQSWRAPLSPQRGCMPAVRLAFYFQRKEHGRLCCWRAHAACPVLVCSVFRIWSRGQSCRAPCRARTRQAHTGRAGRRRTCLHLFRDVPGVFDEVNTSTALHRIAKLSKWLRVRGPPPDCATPAAAQGWKPLAESAYQRKRTFVLCLCRKCALALRLSGAMPRAKTLGHPWRRSACKRAAGARAGGAARAGLPGAAEPAAGACGLNEAASARQCGARPAPA
jgi:hypothetical protein